MDPVPRFEPHPPLDDISWLGHYLEDLFSVTPSSSQLPESSLIIGEEASISESIQSSSPPLSPGSSWADSPVPPTPLTPVPLDTFGAHAQASPSMPLETGQGVYPGSLSSEPTIQPTQAGWVDDDSFVATHTSFLIDTKFVLDHSIDRASRSPAAKHIVSHPPPVTIFNNDAHSGHPETLVHTAVLPEFELNVQQPPHGIKKRKMPLDDDDEDYIEDDDDFEDDADFEDDGDGDYEDDTESDAPPGAKKLKISHELPSRSSRKGSRISQHGPPAPAVANQGGTFQSSRKVIVEGKKTRCRYVGLDGILCNKVTNTENFYRHEARHVQTEARTYLLHHRRNPGSICVLGLAQLQRMIAIVIKCQGTTCKKFEWDLAEGMGFKPITEVSRKSVCLALEKANWEPSALASDDLGKYKSVVTYYAQWFADRLYTCSCGMVKSPFARRDQVNRHITTGGAGKHQVIACWREGAPMNTFES